MCKTIPQQWPPKLYSHHCTLFQSPWHWRWLVVHPGSVWAVWVARWLTGEHGRGFPWCTVQCVMMSSLHQLRYSHWQTYTHILVAIWESYQVVKEQYTIIILHSLDSRPQGREKKGCSRGYKQHYREDTVRSHPGGPVWGVGGRGRAAADTDSATRGPPQRQVWGEGGGGKIYITFLIVIWELYKIWIPDWLGTLYKTVSIIVKTRSMTPCNL